MSVFFLLFLVVIISAVAEGTSGGKEISAQSYCDVSITESDDKLHTPEVENEVKKLYDDKLKTLTLSIYAHSEYKDINVIVGKVNQLNEYVVDNQYMLSEKGYIQAYKYGTDYIEYINVKNLEVSLNTNKEYQSKKYSTETEENKNDYKYFLEVLSVVNKDCSMSVDGLPLDKPYTITGWFPTYNKDGTGGKHKGIDFGVSVGTPLYSVSDGEVVLIGTTCSENGGFLGSTCGAYGIVGGGNYVFIKVQDGSDYYIVNYSHMSQVEVNKGQKVHSGERIGTSGNSGNSSGAHLHFEIHKNQDVNSVGSDKGIINPCEYVEGLCE